MDGKNEFDLRDVEIACLQHLSNGHTESEISQECGLSEHSAAVVLESALRKLDAENIVHAVSKAFRLKIID